jgi:hypothetical protein
VVVPEVGLAVIAAVVVTVQLGGVGIFEHTSELMEELEELCGIVVAELGGETDEWEVFGVHDGNSGVRG